MDWVSNNKFKEVNYIDENTFIILEVSQNVIVYRDSLLTPTASMHYTKLSGAGLTLQLRKKGKNVIYVVNMKQYDQVLASRLLNLNTFIGNSKLPLICHIEVYRKALSAVTTKVDKTTGEVIPVGEPLTQVKTEDLTSVKVGQSNQVNVGQLVRASSSNVTMQEGIKLAGESTNFLKRIKEIANTVNPSKSLLNDFKDGNLYAFLDCEYSHNQDNEKIVREIGFIVTKSVNHVLVPVSTIYLGGKSSTRSTELCYSFVSKIEDYIITLKLEEHCSDFYFVGNGIEDDIINIYDTIGIKNLYDGSKFKFIETGSVKWFNLFMGINISEEMTEILNSPNKSRIEKLLDLTRIQKKTITNLTKSIYKLDVDLSVHTTPFDTTALFCLIELLLLRKYHTEVYREMHFELMSRQEILSFDEKTSSPTGESVLR